MFLLGLIGLIVNFVLGFVLVSENEMCYEDVQNLEQLLRSPLPL